jgi:hypothetical protein
MVMGVTITLILSLLSHPEKRGKDQASQDLYLSVQKDAKDKYQALKPLKMLSRLAQ